MKFRFFIAAILVFAVVSPVRFWAQSDNNDVPLGDIARALRKKKAAPEKLVIDNDNLSKVMDEAEKDRLQGKVMFSIAGSGDKFQVSSPDVTCDLSFSAQNTPLLTEPFIAQELPVSDLLKLEGPATIQGDSMTVTVHNRTRWKISEITVGLTILRSQESAAYFGTARLRPAASTGNDSERQSDFTVLYHIKGMAAPDSTAVFRQQLGGTFPADQDWHWSIVQAKGIPPAAK